MRTHPLASSHLSNSHGHAHAADAAVPIPHASDLLPAHDTTPPHQADDPQHLISHHYEPAEPHGLWPTVLSLGQPVVRAASWTTRGSYTPSASLSTPSTTSSASCSASRVRISLSPICETSTMRELSCVSTTPNNLELSAPVFRSLPVADDLSTPMISF